MTPSASLVWALLSLGLALWALPAGRGAIDGPPSPVTFVAGGLLAGLYCALVAGATAG